ISFSSLCVFTDGVLACLVAESSVSSFEQTNEPFDYNESSTHTSDDLVLNTFGISDKAVDFLKGLLVTRVMPLFYIFIILISLIQEKKPAVIYMSHLACVDLLFTLLLPLKIHYQLNTSDWVFGEAACHVLSVAYYCYMYCSTLLMMSMSVDRLLEEKPHVCMLMLALAGTVPLLSITQTFKIKDVGITCHDVLYHTQLSAYLFSILSCLYFFLPLVITIVSYSTIIYVLTTKNDHLATSYSDKRRRAVIMTIAVLMVFVVCFAPTSGILLYHCVHLAAGNHSGEENSSYTAYLLAVCLGSSSVLVDPLLYYYGSSQCRKQFWSVLRYTVE
uniref:G-protein coupled receptors family 1 profile domain-containing protein n=1 Tax=Sinocyclocheilus anshuiensis TaxID=1608454 RepID=A0A671RHE7_9TELE